LIPSIEISTVDCENQTQYINIACGQNSSLLRPVSLETANSDISLVKYLHLSVGMKQLDPHNAVCMNSDIGDFY